MTDNKSSDKKVHFAPYCNLTEIKSHKNMSEEVKNMLWYHHTEICKFRKNIDDVIQFRKCELSTYDFFLIVI